MFADHSPILHECHRGFSFLMDGSDKQTIKVGQEMCLHCIADVTSTADD